MNDLEHDLRTLLDEKASTAGVPVPDARLLRRARRWQVGTVLAGVVIAAAIVGGVAVGVATLGPGGNRTPADTTESLVDTTVNGVTVAHPQSWRVVDPVEAGITPETETTTRLILLMTDAEELTAQAISCPGLAGDERRGGVVMTIQELPLALAGEDARPWPVDLVPLVDPGDDPSGCVPGWTFLRGSWTASGRSFEARVGFGPDVSDEQREALEAAFASLRFEPFEGEPEAVVLATGSAGGEDWELIAERSSDGLVLSLQGETWGGGAGGFEDLPLLLQTSLHIFGGGDEREVVVFGAVREPGARVEAFPVLGGPAVAVPVIDVPEGIGGDLDAFVLVYRPDLPELGVDLNLYDEYGNVLTTVELRPRGDFGDGDAVPDEVLFRGRTNGCFWTLSRWSQGPDRELLRLMPRDGDGSVELAVDTSLDAPPLQLASFDCPSDDTNAVLVFGLATEDVADIAWPDALGADGGPPSCIDSTLPSRLCVFLEDFNGPGEAVALDADGNEIARVPYG